MEYELSSDQQDFLDTIISVIDGYATEYSKGAKILKNIAIKANPEKEDEIEEAIVEGKDLLVGVISAYEDIKLAYVKRLNRPDVIANPEKATYINGQIRVMDVIIARIKSIY